MGSTGSIGRQALEVIAAYPEFFEVEVLTAQNNAALLVDQAKRYKPNAVLITNDAHYSFVKEQLSNDGIKVFSGEPALSSIVTMDSIDLVLTALVGYCGLKPTINAIEAGKTIALANKETLVVAGELVTELARKKGVNIYPVDSEHSAIFQCIVGEFQNKIEKIILTASGGPFRGKKAADLKKRHENAGVEAPQLEYGR